MKIPNFKTPNKNPSFKFPDLKTQTLKIQTFVALFRTFYPFLNCKGARKPNFHYRC